MTTTQITATLRAHATCRQTGIDCTVPHCRTCAGEGGPCDGDCEGTGQARCECGELAVQFVVDAERGREAVCGACAAVPEPTEPDTSTPAPQDSPEKQAEQARLWRYFETAEDASAPPPADPGRTVRIPAQTNAELVWGSR